MFGSRENAFKLDKLKPGYTLDLNMKAWEIVEIATYDWKADGSSIEYTLKAKDATIIYLEVEYYKGKYDVCFSKAVAIEEQLLEAAIHDKAITFKGRLFTFEDSYKGAYRNETKGSRWENLTANVFQNKKDTITIEDWGSGDYDVFFGTRIKAKAIKNIKAGKI